MLFNVDIQHYKSFFNSEYSQISLNNNIFLVSLLSSCFISSGTINRLQYGERERERQREGGEGER